jgi:hypothetical protein
MDVFGIRVRLSLSAFYAGRKHEGKYQWAYHSHIFGAVSQMLRVKT